MPKAFICAAVLPNYLATSRIWSGLIRQSARTEEVHMAAIITTPRLMAVGGGALAELPSMLARLGLTRPLIVTDPFLVSSGHLERATGHLDRAGVPWKGFSEPVPAPPTAGGAPGA